MSICILGDTSSSTNNFENAIFLTYLNGSAFSFNVDDYMRIRLEHRIVGALVGTCRTRGWTSGANGLPAIFSRYETQLLVEKANAVLLNKRRLLLNQDVDSSLCDKYEELITKRIEEQMEHLKEKKVEESLKVIDKIVLGKRKKLRKSGVPESDIKITKEDIIKELKATVCFDRNNALLEIPNESFFENECERYKLPPIDHDINYRVFKDLWGKGKYVTSGESFGADFIAYPGDPMMYHASHIVVVLKDTKVNPLTLIGKCRMSVIVNKICLFAYENDAKEIMYETVHWENNENQI